MMKVVQLQYILRSSGDFAIRLHHEFLGRGLDSHVIGLFSNTESTERITHFGKKEQLKSRLDNRIQAHWLKDADPQYGSFSSPYLGTDVSKLDTVKSADIIYVHWVLNGFMNYNSFEKLAQLGKPIIFIMHDMWSMTGGCHYSFECEKYISACNNCQMLKGNKERDLSTIGFEKKLALFAKYDNLHFVSPSKWLYECALKSKILADKPVYHIPNILDRKIFKPIDQSAARHILNIPSEEIVIAFGAVSVNSPYKGWNYLKNAIQRFQSLYETNNLSVLIFGGSHNDAIAQAIPFKTRFLGRLHDEYTISLVYNAANVFIAPSLADNLPYTIFEALSSGTPVVAFNTGGIPDMVLHRQNGYLAEYKNSEDVANGIAYCLEHKLKGFVPDEMDNELSLKKHMELIEQSKKVVMI